MGLQDEERGMTISYTILKLKKNGLKSKGKFHRNWNARLERFQLNFGGSTQAAASQTPLRLPLDHNPAARWPTAEIRCDCESNTCQSSGSAPIRTEFAIVR